MSDDNAKLGAKALKDFCESWGDDVHANILLEVLFEGIMNEEAVFVFGQPKQTGDQTSDSPSGTISSDIQIDEHK
jgi:hypothetical protein